MRTTTTLEILMEAAVIITPMKDLLHVMMTGIVIIWARVNVDLFGSL